MSEIGLGRRHAPDERDRNYLLPRRAPLGPSSKHWLSLGPVLDQGGTSQCVAYSGTKYLTTHPIVNKPPLAPADLYRECQRVDEWPGEEPDYEGTSVRALFKVLKRIGLVTEYRWAFDAPTVISHVLTRGPVVLGTDWHLDMFTPDRWGYIWPIGESVCGHAYLMIGASQARKNPDGTVGAARILNSWGPNWAERGRAWLAFHALEYLIANQGEACCATEIKAPKEG